jgi:PAS domain S-box-containing protein
MMGSEAEPSEGPISEIKYRDFLEGFGAAILALDLEGRFLFLNDQALALFGYGRDEAALAGQHFTKLLTPEQATVALELFQQGREIRPVVLEAMRKDGRMIRVEVSGAWVRRRGKRVGALAMAWELSAAPEPVAGKRRELTKLDMTILQLVSSGLSNREIAERVYLSKHTIKDRIEKIMRYFGVSRRAELAAKAARQGLV